MIVPTAVYDIRRSLHSNCGSRTGPVEERWKHATATRASHALRTEVPRERGPGRLAQLGAGAVVRMIDLDRAGRPGGQEGRPGRRIERIARVLHLADPRVVLPD